MKRILILTFGFLLFGRTTYAQDLPDSDDWGNASAECLVRVGTLTPDSEIIDGKSYIWPLLSVNGIIFRDAEALDKIRNSCKGGKIGPYKIIKRKLIYGPEVLKMGIKDADPRHGVVLVKVKTTKEQLFDIQNL